MITICKPGFDVVTDLNPTTRRNPDFSLATEPLVSLKDSILVRAFLERNRLTENLLDMLNEIHIYMWPIGWYQPRIDFIRGDYAIDEPDSICITVVVPSDADPDVIKSAFYEINIQFEEMAEHNNYLINSNLEFAD